MGRSTRADLGYRSAKAEMKEYYEDGDLGDYYDSYPSTSGY